MTLNKMSRREMKLWEGTPPPVPLFDEKGSSHILLRIGTETEADDSKIVTFVEMCYPP